MGGNTRESGRSTSSRLLALLAAFTSDEPVLALTRLAQLSDQPVGTVHRLAAELTAWGALERLPGGRFQVGMRLWHVGALAPGHRYLRSAALPFMEDLYEVTHENVQLAVRAGRTALALDHIMGRQSVQTMTEVAGGLPLHATGVGKVILAFSDPELFAAVVADGLPRLTRSTITLPGVLAEALKQVRESQVAFSLEEMSVGASSVAAPIFGGDGSLAAALGVVVRSSTRLGSLTAAVRTAALGVTRRLSRDYLDSTLPPGGS